MANPKERSWGATTNGRRTVAAFQSPVARMVLAGGVVHVPTEAYLRRLQRLARSGKGNAYAYSLYPGIAHVAAANDIMVAQLFRAILNVSEAGRHLEGLEPLFLSCLQGVEVAGRRKLALAGLAAWEHSHPGNKELPFVMVDRRTNQVMFIPPSLAAASLRSLRSKAFIEASVWDLLMREQEGADAQTPEVRVIRADASDNAMTASVCKDRVSAWSSYVKASIAVVGIALAIGEKDRGGFGSAVVQVADAFLSDVVQPIANFACDQLFPDQTSPAGDLPAGTEPAGAPSDPSEWSPYEPSSPPGGAPGDSTDSENDPEKEWNDWPTASDSATPPPPPPGDDTTPNPDDDTGNYSRPPGVGGPWPPEGELPNPDDLGGSGASFPNGAVFIPLRVVRALNQIARTSVTAAEVGVTPGGATVLQLSVNESALGAGLG